VKPLRARYTRIERHALDLLRRADSNHPPVDALKIANLAGASVHFEPFDDDISGVLIRNEHSTAIGVNKAHASVRQRFTIAHELGHLLLHDGVPIRIDKDFRVNWRKGGTAKAPDIEEIEANFFAASLLMPKSMLTNANRLDHFDVEDDLGIVRLARLFRVSTQAMTFRLGELFRSGAFG
jgi:Zn-dependent peptidase ImmA (M78 family)